jgi:hypothetical protein
VSRSPVAGCRPLVPAISLLFPSGNVMLTEMGKDDFSAAVPRSPPVAGCRPLDPAVLASPASFRSSAPLRLPPLSVSQASGAALQRRPKQCVLTCAAMLARPSRGWTGGARPPARARAAGRRGRGSEEAKSTSGGPLELPWQPIRRATAHSSSLHG